MNKALILSTAVIALSFSSCTVESMGTYSHEFTPFGKPIEKIKELKSTTTKPDDTIKMTQ